MADRELQKTRVLGEDKDIALEKLTSAYASNLITMEDFEKKAGAIENASRIDEINSALADIQGIKANKIDIASGISDVERIKNHGSSKKISGSLLKTKRLEIDIAHCSLSFDYQNVDMPSGIYDIVLESVHSSCRFLVPENVDIDYRANETYSSFVDRRGNIGNQNEKIVLRISGELIHSSIAIKRPKEKVLIRILRRFI
jgi:hypothetical protein